MKSIWGELRRRNVFKVAVFYVVTGWLLLQVADLLFDLLGLPDWTLRFVFGLIALGFPVALIFSYVYEITPEGIKREREIDRTQSIAPETGQKLNVVNGVLLALAVGLLLYQQFGPGFGPGRDSTVPETPATQVAESSAAADPPASSVETQAPESRKSVAVLPFRNMSPDPDQDYFSEGLADTLIHVLAQIEDLKVAARTSSFAFKDQQVDVRDIADKLGVATVLEGSVQKSGDRMRIIAQLIDASDGTHLWSANFDRSAQDIFVIQDEIATEVVKALKGALLDADTEQLVDRYQPSLEAYRSFLRGRQEMAKRSSAALEAAQRHFEEALKTDPDYPLALVNLGDTYSLQAVHAGRPRPESIALAEPLYLRAIELEPELGEAYTSLGLLYEGKGLAAKSMEYFEKGIELAPNYSTAYHWYALRVGDLGEIERALQLFYRAAELDPLSDVIKANIIDYLTAVGRKDEAVAMVDQAIADSPDYADYRTLKASQAFEAGDLGRGIYELRKALSIDPGKIGTHFWLCLNQLDLPDPGVGSECVDQVANSNSGSDLVINIQMWRAILEGRPSEAIELGRSYGETTNLTESRGVDDLLAIGYMVTGEYQRAIELWLTEHPELSPQSDAGAVDGDNWDEAVSLAYLWQQLGELERATGLIEAVRPLIQGRNRFGPGGIGIADVHLHALAGEYERAVVTLAEAIDDGWLLGWRWEFLHNPILEPLRQREDFRELGDRLQRKLAEQQAWLEAQPPIEIEAT